MPFQKGVSGNPKGRTKRGKTITDALRLMMKEKQEDGDTFQRKFTDRLISIALKGEDQVALQALKYAIDRLDGSPISMAELAELEQAQSGAGVQVTITRRDKDAGNAGSSAETV